MSSQLTIYVHSSDDITPDEAKVSIVRSEHDTESNELCSPSVRLDKELLETLTPYSSILCVFPAEWATVIPVTLPKAPARALNSALPFLIEELLIENIDRYKVINVCNEDRDYTALCAVPVEWLGTWCRWFDETVPYTPVRFTLDAWLLPGSAGEVTRVDCAGRCLVRYGNALCGAFPDKQTDLWFDSFQAEREEAPDVSTSKIVDENELALLIAREAKCNTPPDIRRDEFRQILSKGPVAAIALLLGGLSVSCWLLIISILYNTHQVELATYSVREKSETTYRDAFSEEGILVNLVSQAKTRISRQEDALRLVDWRSGFTDTFSSLASSLRDWLETGAHQASQITFNYGSQRYQLVVNADSLEALNRLQRELNSGNIESSLTGAKHNSVDFTGTLILEISK